MELIIVFLLFCLSKNHRSGFSSYQYSDWNQVFFLNEFEGAQLYVDGYPVGISESGVLYFPPNRREINVQYINGDQILMNSNVQICSPKTFFVAKWQQNRLLRVK